MRKFNYSLIFKNFRKIHELTQVQMANQFETEQSRISKIENGIVSPDANEILHLIHLNGDSTNEELLQYFQNWKEKKELTA